MKSFLITFVFIAAPISLNTSILFYPSGPYTAGESYALAIKNSSFADDEIKKELSLKRNIINFNRVSGMLTDFLRVQKKLFFAKNGNKHNEISLKAEGLFNEASLHASQSDYNEGYEILETIYKMLSGSIKELQGKK